MYLVFETKASAKTWCIYQLKRTESKLWNQNFGGFFFKTYSVDTIKILIDFIFKHSTVRTAVLTTPDNYAGEERK